MSIQFTIRCDGCGHILASSSISARAARADAMLKRGANHGPDGDHCADCRKKRLAELDEQRKAHAKERAERPWAPGRHWG